MKSTAGSQDVDAYIAAAAKEAQPVLRRLRQIIKKSAPSADERISYGMPYYDRHGRLVYFGVHARHVGLYPVGDPTRHVKELARYATGPGTLRFPLDEPLPVALIERLVKARVKENEAKAAARLKGAAAKKAAKRA